MASEVGVAYVRILPTMKGFAPEVRKGMSGPAAAAGKASGRGAGRGFVGAFGGSLKGIGGIFAGAFAAKQVVGFIGDTISAASDLGESINAVQVVFGDASDEIIKLGENAATAVGLSQTEFQAAAVQFSAFAKTIAGEGGNVAGTVDELTTRVADFASVMNIDVAEAATLFQSGLAGETEPLRRYGIDVSAAAVETFAYANGIAEAGEKLTEAEKVQARYGLIMEQTNQTQGDFANTSDSLANRQRILSAQWTDMKARLGQALVPVAESALNLLGRFLPVLEGLISGGSGAGSAFATIGNVLGQIWAVMQPLVPVFVELGRRFMDLLMPAISQIGTLLSETLLPSFLSFFEAVRPILSWLIETIGGSLLNAFSGAITFISGALETISGILDVFTGIFTGDWSKAWEGVKKIASGVWNMLKGAFQVFINIGIAKVLRIGLNLVKSLFRAGWNVVKNLASSAWSAVRGTISKAWSKIKSGVSSGISNVVSFMKGLPGRVLRALGNLGRLLLGAGKALLRGLWDGMKSMWSSVSGWFSSKLDWLSGLWPFSPAKHGPLRKRPPEEGGANVVAGFAAGMQSGLGDIVRAAEASAMAALIPMAASTPGPPMPAGPDEMVATVPIDLGEGIAEVVRIKLERRDRAMKQRLMAGTGGAR